MSVTDPIADMLARIRNAIMARHETVEVPASKMKYAIARILEREGFIERVEYLHDRPGGTLKITLRYYDGRQPAITGLKRISRPSLRVYVGRREIPRVYGGLGIAILSTPQGVMTDREAWRRGIGGELLCAVW
jgi:small subunit ribosomal protein S8